MFVLQRHGGKAIRVHFLIIFDVMACNAKLDLSGFACPYISGESSFAVVGFIAVLTSWYVS